MHGAVDGGGRVAEVSDEAAPEGHDVVLALAARGSVADEDERSGSVGVGRCPEQARYRPSLALDVETALAHPLGDVILRPVHRRRVPVP